MGMKELHVMPNDHDKKLKYMRENTYFSNLKNYGLEHNDGREFGIVDELGSYHYVLAITEIDEDTKQLASSVSVVPLRPESKGEHESEIAIDWIFEEMATCGFCSIDFLLKLHYDSNKSYFWRKRSWEIERPHEKSLLNLTLCRWLFPKNKPTNKNLPNLMLRLSGEWKGWTNTPSVDHQHKRYDGWEKDDKVEDEAFEIYKNLVKPLGPMPVTAPQFSL